VSAPRAGRARRDAGKDHHGERSRDDDDFSHDSILAAPEYAGSA
jgi:hypothetical protein